ncbi:MAG TPA: hypothetical protein VFM09_00795 [Marmoricola sp.]|nr:hypothetical protein [Marmoricola sp.]
MQHRPERPIDLEGVPGEENVPQADASDQLEHSAEEQQNLSGEARRRQQESREHLAAQIEEGTSLADRRIPEDR